LPIKGLLLLASILFVAGCSRTSKSPILEQGEIEYGGRIRSYFLVRPAGLEERNSIPLVLALHGGGGRARQMCRLAGGVQELASEAGFLVACPDGIDKHWNDGRQVPARRTVRENIDDVGFLLALVRELESQFPIDAGQIFVTGVSNGGMMSLRMACDAAGIFSAVAAVIAELPADLDCSPQAPISVMLLNGTDDPLVPWQGGEVHFLRQKLGKVLSTDETVSFWVHAEGCNEAPAVDWLADGDPQDGTLIRREIYTDCLMGAQVMLFAVEGGGHTWPGGIQYAPRFLVGRVSSDAVAGELIWSFFAAQNHSVR